MALKRPALDNNFIAFSGAWRQFAQARFCSYKSYCEQPIQLEFKRQFGVPTGRAASNRLLSDSYCFGVSLDGAGNAAAGELPGAPGGGPYAS